MSRYRLRLKVSVEIMENLRRWGPKETIDNIGTKEEFLKEYQIPPQGKIIDTMRNKIVEDNSKDVNENYETMVEQLMRIDPDDWEDVVYSIATGDYDI